MEMSMIKTEIEIDKARKKSSIGEGRGTMMIAMMATIKPTRVRDFALSIGLKMGPI